MWPNPQFPVDLVTFAAEILNGKLHFLHSECSLGSISFEALMKDFLKQQLIYSLI